MRGAIFIGCNLELHSQSKDRPSMLFIFVDDLPPKLGISAHSNIRTSNINNKLAIKKRKYSMIQRHVIGNKM